MAGWAPFLATTALVAVGAVVLATLTGRAVRERVAAAPPERARRPSAVLGVSRLGLYANAAASQGFLLVILAGAAVLTSVEPAPLGVAHPGLAPVGAGVGLGLVLAGVNEGVQRAVDRLGVDYDASLRHLLAPSSAVEWLALLVVVLPVVAVFEEALFRAALVGGVAAALGVSPWLAVVPAAAAFALGHGLQGTGGLLAAGVLGLLLGVGFVLTGSLLAVVLAHYLVNAIEFARHRG